MSVTNLGKKVYTVLRTDPSNAGSYVDGEYVPATKTEIKIKANIQADFSMKYTLLLPEGDRAKQRVWGSSNQWVYTAESGIDPVLEPDIILFRDSLWEVKAVMPYTNFGKHIEFVAVKIDNVALPRKEGSV